MIATLMLAQAMVATIDYRVSVAPGAAAPVVIVDMTFPGDDDGETDIELPAKWAGSSELWRSITLLGVDGGERVASPDPARWRIRHQPGARLIIRYTVAGGQRDAPDAATFEKARPVIGRDWLSIHNQGAIAMPHGRENAPATFAFGPVASGWQVVSDLTAPGHPLIANDVAEGVIVGGTGMRLASRQVGGRTLRVAMIGTWPFPDAALADPVARLIAIENATLGAPAIDFLVTLVPLAGSATVRSAMEGRARPPASRWRRPTMCRWATSPARSHTNTHTAGSAARSARARTRRATICSARGSTTGSPTARWSRVACGRRRNGPTSSTS